MNTSLDLFIEDAKLVTIEVALPLLGLPSPTRGREYMGSCPISGGKDRFSYNVQKNVWNCRGCGEGGHGAIGLASHVLGLDCHNRQGFIAACEAVLGRPAPDKNMKESSEEHKLNEEKAKVKRAEAQKNEEQRQKQAEQYRQTEQLKAKEKWTSARLLGSTRFCSYIERRCGALIQAWALRLQENEPYFHHKNQLYNGPAMVAPFVAQDGHVVGCHITWLDLTNAPKFRPLLKDPQTGEHLPTKKMRGSKKGGLIPLRGFTYKNGLFTADKTRRRMVVGEGIETVLATAVAEGERSDTIYAAAGDLGNMAGPATPESRFQHPTLKRQDKNGRSTPVFVAGAVPLIDRKKADSVWVPDWIDDLVLIADSDSERVMTASAMARAKARFAKAGRRIPVLWPPQGYDVADMMATIGGKNG